MIGITLGLNGGGGTVKENYAIDFDGSSELLSTVPALNLTGEYSLQEDFADGNFDGWTVQGGAAYSVVDASPLSGGLKALKCDTAGVISIPCNQAYGSWEFDWFKGSDTSVFQCQLINKYIMARGSGVTEVYTFLPSSDEAIYLVRDFNTYLTRTAASYISFSTWYRTRITRNTNGQFYVYIKGGAFGDSYTLISVSGGSGTNPVSDNTYTSSNYIVLDLDAGDMIANIVCEYGEGIFDLNGYDRIMHSDSRFFESGIGSWSGTGNHSLVQSNEDKRTGTYSGKIISSAAGDVDNCVLLATNGFRTFIAGEKYTLEFWTRGIGVESEELISNGDFSSEIGWSIESPWAISGGTLNGNSATLGAAVSQKISVGAGQVVKVTFTITGRSTGNVGIRQGSNGTEQIVSTNATHTVYLTAGASSPGLLIIKGYSGFNGSVDSVSTKVITIPGLQLTIGNQNKIFSNISVVPGSFTKLVWNILVTASEVGQPLKIWLSQADSIYIDEFTISKAYDLMLLWWFKTNASTGTFWSYAQIGTSGAEGYTAYINNNQCRVLSSDGTPIFDGAQSINTSVSINDGNWKFLDLRINRATDELSISVNRGTSNTDTHRLGRQRAFENVAFYIAAFRDLSNKLSGQLGGLQLIKFDDISLSNVTSQKLLEIYNRRTLIKGEFTGGGANEIALYDWKGQEADFCNDKSGKGNHLTKTNITLADRVMR